MAPAGQRLVLCEEKIREKSGLSPHRDLGAWRLAGRMVGGGALAEDASFPTEGPDQAGDPPHTD